MKTLPLRIKLALWTGLAMTLVLVAFAASTLIMLYQREVSEGDDDIESETKELIIEFAKPGAIPETVVWQLDPHMGWAVFSSDGRLLRADPIITEEAARPALQTAEVIHTGAFPNDWRVRAFRPESAHAPGRIVVVGYSMEKVYDIMRGLIVAYLWTLPLAALITALSSWWVAGRLLRPFLRLSNQIESIGLEHLEQRLPVPPARDEIRRLATSFNAMLERLGRGFEQTRRFAADASHELRTPLTIVRGEIELMLREPDTTPPQQTKLASLQEEIARLERITEQLMLLAKFDASQVRMEMRDLDFSQLLADTCEQAELLANTASVKLTTDIEPGLRINGDAAHLRRLLLNLLDNACKYNNAGGSVSVTCGLAHSQKENCIRLRIGNTGPGIPPEMRERIFERFFRSDQSRSDKRGHGLGLALCREIAHLHGATLSLAVPDDSRADGWTEFVIEFSRRKEK